MDRKGSDSRSARSARQARTPACSSKAAPRAYRVAGLFAGIGGIELGLHGAGHTPILLCEKDPGARAVLADKEIFSSVPLVEDVLELDGFPLETDLVAAGFPCQDLSQAGPVRGLDGDQSGLILRVLEVLRSQPIPWVLLENVPFMLRLARGRALEIIVRELEDLGYGWAYRVVDARAFGLPQRRERVFLLASLDGDPRSILLADEAGPPGAGPLEPAGCYGFYWTEGNRGVGLAIDAVPALKGGSALGIPSPPAIVVPRGGVVTPDIRDAERLQGFRSNWTLAAQAVARPSMRWKLVGNSVNVRVSTWIGRRLARPKPYDDSGDVPLPAGSPWPRAAWSLGKERYRANRSTWPVRKQAPPLLDFLKFDPRPLSLKAADGFLNRARASSLRFRDGFLEEIAAHVRAMRQSGTRDRPVSLTTRARR